MMSNIYLVQGHSGEHDYYQTWIVAGAKTYEQASEHAGELSVVADNLKARYDKSHNRVDWDAHDRTYDEESGPAYDLGAEIHWEIEAGLDKRHPDPKFRVADGVSYSVIAVQLLGGNDEV